VLALKTEFLLKILNKITRTFSECSKIALYAGLNDLRRKSVEDLKALKQAGLTLAYTGLESGDPMTLKRIKKGLTPEQAEKGMAKAKAAGIDILVSIIFGIGGKERSREHIVETTRLLNSMKPEQIAPMALTVQPGTERNRLKPERSSRQLRCRSSRRKSTSSRTWQALRPFTGAITGTISFHSRGILPESRERFIDKIEHAIADHPVTEQEVLRTSPW
jgi:radical SAM superfamily enzyme YgiQ (UPF0313 family)